MSDLPQQQSADHALPAASDSSMSDLPDGPESPLSRMTRLVAPLVRRHNVAIFLVIVTGLVSVGIVTTTHVFPEVPDWMGYLTALRIVLPILALVSTAVVTQRRITHAARAAGGAPVEIEVASVAFARSKSFSTWSMAACGLVGAGSLLVGHRTLDIGLALVPLLLMVLGRPSVAALVTFFDLLRSENETVAPRSMP